MSLQEGVSRQLRCIFTVWASRWGGRHPSEGERLAEGIFSHWKSSSLAAGVIEDVGELIVDQIQNMAKQCGMPPEEVVECVFMASTAPRVLSLLQLA